MGCFSHFVVRQSTTSGKPFAVARLNGQATLWSQSVPMEVNPHDPKQYPWDSRSGADACRIALET
jgi:hypothetical protein